MMSGVIFVKSPSVVEVDLSGLDLFPLLVNYLGIIILLPCVHSINCFRCTLDHIRYKGELDQPCSEFDQSSRFYQDCLYSTFCLKRIARYTLHDGSVTSTAVRGCAQQSYIAHTPNEQTMQWETEVKIDELAYSEGCFNVTNNDGISESEYCYCSSNYCNSSSSLTILEFFKLLVIVGILIFKFF